MCGIYSLRPSYCRLPYYGARNCLEGQESIMSVLGPMTNSLSGLKIFTKVSVRSYYLRHAHLILLNRPFSTLDLGLEILSVLGKCGMKKLTSSLNMAEEGGGNALRCFLMMGWLSRTRRFIGQWILCGRRWKQLDTKVSGFTGYLCWWN